MLLLLSTLVSLLPLVSAYEPNEPASGNSVNILPYCSGAYRYHDSSFNAPEVQPLRWTVYNATVEKDKDGSPKAKNISDTPLYVKTLNTSDYEINPTSGTVSYLYILDVPAGNYLNAYLSDSSNPPRVSEAKVEGYYVAHTASYMGGGNHTCNQTFFAQKAGLPFDNASTLAFNSSAWPTSDARSVASAPGSILLLAGAAAVVAAMGGGLSL